MHYLISRRLDCYGKPFSVLTEKSWPFLLKLAPSIDLPFEQYALFLNFYILPADGHGYEHTNPRGGRTFSPLEKDVILTHLLQPASLLILGAGVATGMSIEAAPLPLHRWSHRWMGNNSGNPPPFPSPPCLPL